MDDQKISFCSTPPPEEDYENQGRAAYEETEAVEIAHNIESSSILEEEDQQAVEE